VRHRPGLQRRASLRPFTVPAARSRGGQEQNHVQSQLRESRGPCLITNLSNLINRPQPSPSPDTALPLGLHGPDPSRAAGTNPLGLSIERERCAGLRSRQCPPALTVQNMLPATVCRPLSGQGRAAPGPPACMDSMPLEARGLAPLASPSGEGVTRLGPRRPTALGLGPKATGEGHVRTAGGRAWRTWPGWDVGSVGDRGAARDSDGDEQMPLLE
jgi:hypothetical protein